jgi:hypothetical protein
VTSPAVLGALALISLLAGALQAERALRAHRPAMELWWMITCAITVTFFFFALFAGAQFGFIAWPMSVAATPLLTVVLSLRLPIPWGCAASAVTVLHGAAWIGSRLAGVSYASADLDTLATAYVLNALLVAGLNAVNARSR